MTYLRQRNYDIRAGREEGRSQAKIEIADNMLNKNYPLEDIAEITELPLETIQELSSQMNQEA